MQDVAPAGTHAELPRQVVQPDVVELDRRRVDVEHLCEVALEDHRGTAEPDRLVALVEQRLRDDADGVREVDDPAVGRERADALGDVEHDRHGAERLREPAEACRLLADAAALQGERLVDDARGLAADTELDQHGRGAFDPFFEPPGRKHGRRMAAAGEHAAASSR